jgi:hypothetical protein
MGRLKIDPMSLKIPFKMRFFGCGLDLVNLRKSSKISYKKAVETKQNTIMTL